MSDQATYEYLQCHATVVNNTEHRMTVGKIDPGMWGKWIQNPTDVPAGKTMHFSAQGRSSSPSGTEAKIQFQLVGTDPGVVLDISFSVPLSGSNKYAIIESPKGSVRTKAESLGDNDNDLVVRFTVDPQ